ncbi:MAG: hypothetical protein K2X66_18340, partial [Cyanobacteria bacterium]|nr:hypothetical protein [Cyanobacteriota bacterium]
SQNIAAFSESSSPSVPVNPTPPVNPFTMDFQYSENKPLSGALAFAPWNTFKVQPFHTQPSQDSPPNSNNTFPALSPHQPTSVTWVDPVESVGSLMLYLSGLCLTAVVLLYSAISPVMSAVAQDLKTLHPNLSLHPTPLEKSITGYGPASTSPLPSGIFPTEICCIAQKSSAPSSDSDPAKTLGLQSPDKQTAGSVSSEVSLKLPWEVVRQGQRHNIVSLCNSKATCVVFEKKVPESIPNSQTASPTKLLKLEGLYQENSIQEIRYKTLGLPTPFSLETLHDILNPSPESLSPFLSPSENKQLLNALFLKRYLLENMSHIYHLKTPQWEGYQLGSPQQDPWVQVILFETNPQNLSSPSPWISLNFGTLSPVNKSPTARFPHGKAIQQQEIFQIIDNLKPQKPEN